MGKTAEGMHLTAATARGEGYQKGSFTVNVPWRGGMSRFEFGAPYLVERGGIANTTRLAHSIV